MPNLLDLTGEKFHYLTVITRDKNDQAGNVRWRCLCKCGAKTVVVAGNLRAGRTKSCGCWVSKATSARMTAHWAVHGHGYTGTRTYRTWASMLERCRSPNSTVWKWYGGRGIAVCARWYDFSKFLADMGERPAGKSIDRINNSKGYTPQNCRWATRKEQAQNRRPPRK